MDKPGDANQITRDYFDAMLLELRQIDAVVPDTTCQLYGETFATPIMTAALSHLDRARPNGMATLARGARDAGAVMWAGMGDEAELEAIVATGAKTIVVIKPYADHDLVLRRIDHARRCGVLAIGMDVDHAFDQQGQLGSVLGYPMAAKSTAQIKDYVQAAQVPFIIKGVLSVSDAQKCLEAGVRGMVVSHHHGIQDYALPPLMILPEILRRVGSAMPVFVDCGVNSGIDAFKALALGASAVCTGRVLIPHLSDKGSDGVRAKIAAMTDELRATMARTGSPDLNRIDPAVIWRR